MTPTPFAVQKIGAILSIGKSCPFLDRFMTAICLSPTAPRVSNQKKTYPDYDIRACRIACRRQTYLGFEITTHVHDECWTRRSGSRRFPACEMHFASLPNVDCVRGNLWHAFLFGQGNTASSKKANQPDWIAHAHCAAWEKCQTLGALGFCRVFVVRSGIIGCPTPIS